MEGIEEINSVKLRVGYGVTGNQGIDNYQSIVNLSTGGVYPQNGVYLETYGPAKNPNPDLRWEKKREWNVGLDFSLFEDRLSGSIDMYHRETVDVLHYYQAQLPTYVQSRILTKIGIIRNKGFDLSSYGEVMRIQAFSWDMNIAASTQSDELTSWSNDIYSL